MGESQQELMRYAEGHFAVLSKDGASAILQVRGTDVRVRLSLGDETATIEALTDKPIAVNFTEGALKYLKNLKKRYSLSKPIDLDELIDYISEQELADGQLGWLCERIRRKYDI